MNKRIKGFAPIVFEDSEVLLLGTLPGAVSLKKNIIMQTKETIFWSFFLSIQDMISPKVMRKL